MTLLNTFIIVGTIVSFVGWCYVSFTLVSCKDTLKAISKAYREYGENKED